jgi:GcrA cell cycle regulator
MPSGNGPERHPSSSLNIKTDETPAKPRTEAEWRRLLQPFADSSYATWSDDDLVTLCREWCAGTSTARIGALIGKTKNAAVGKSHRLIKAGILQPRPSPILARWAHLGPRPVQPLHAPKVTLPGIASVPAPPPPPVRAVRKVTVTHESTRGPAVTAEVWVTAEYDAGQVIVGASPVPAATRTPPATPTQPRPIRAPQPRPYGRITECCWPIGEPGTRAFHFCDVPSDPGISYCGDHARVAFVRIRPPARVDDYARPDP